MLTRGNGVIFVHSSRFSPQIVKYRRESGWQFRERLTPYIGRFISVNAGGPRFRGSVCLSLTSDTMSHHHPWRLKTRRRYDGISYARDISRYIEFDARILSVIRYESNSTCTAGPQSHFMLNTCGAMRDELEILDAICSNSSLLYDTPRPAIHPFVRRCVEQRQAHRVAPSAN